MRAKIKKITSIACSIAALLVFGVACQTSETPSGAEISLTAQTATIDYYQTLELNANVVNSNQPITWSSSDEQIAVVQNGIVIPTNNIGDVTITATVEDVSASCLVSVVKSGEAPVLTLGYEELALELGGEFTIEANVLFQGEPLKEKYTYCAELAYGAQEGVAQAEVSDNAITFTALSAGETAYEVSTVVRDLTLVKRVNVRVVNPEVVFTSDTLEPVQGGFALNLGLTETEEYATYGNVEMSAYQNGERLTDFLPDWTMEETDVFSFNNGEVRALKEGSGVLTAAYRGETITVYVNVVRPLIERTEALVMETVNSKMELPISLNGEILSAALENKANGKQYSFAATGLGKELTYDSSMLPKAASDLGEQRLMIETDKAKYRFSVVAYTMIINDEEELNSLIPTAKAVGNGTYWTGYFVLGNDIRCKGTYVSQWDGKRVGDDALSDSTGFNGIFDGCGYTIYDLKTTGTTGGLIPCLNAGGEIKNVSLVNALNTGKGGVICSLCCGKVENVFVSVSVKGEQGTRNRNYTSAFVSDVISTARIQKVFVEILEKTGDTKYCNPFYQMHEGYGIVNSFYATGTDVLWEKSQWEGTQGAAKDCGAYKDAVAMHQAGVSTASWANDFWAVYNGLPYPKALPNPAEEAVLVLSASKAFAGETVEIVELSKNTLVELAAEANAFGVELIDGTIVLPSGLESGTKIIVYASIVYAPTQYVAVEIVIITESDLMDGELDNEDVWN